MTWQRYFGAPMGEHTCPACQQKSRFHRSPTSWARQLIMVCVGGIPFALISSYLFHQWLIGWLICGLLIGIPLDKYYDGKYRRLDKF